MMECAAADLELAPGGARRARWACRSVCRFKEIALHSLFRSGGPIAATHGFVFDGPGFDPKRASIHQSRVRQSRRLHVRRALRGSRCRHGTGAVEVRRAWCAHDVGPCDQSGELRRTDPGRLRAGNGLRADRSDALERGRLAHDDHARRLQDSGRARRSARHSRDRAGGSRADASAGRQGHRRAFARRRRAGDRQRHPRRNRCAR